VPVLKIHFRASSKISSFEQRDFKSHWKSTV
jgi:hypothetical protein